MGQATIPHSVSQQPVKLTASQRVSQHKYVASGDPHEADLREGADQAARSLIVGAEIELEGRQPDGGQHPSLLVDPLRPRKVYEVVQRVSHDSDASSSNDQVRKRARPRPRP